MSLLPTISNKYSLGAFLPNVRWLSKYLDTVINRVNTISSGDGAVTANTIAEQTSGTGVSISGQRFPVVSGSGATVTLTAAQSGATIMFDRAAGIIYTLPAATAANKGVHYKFIVQTTISSNNAEVDAASSSDLMYGTVVMKEASADDTTFAANGSSNYKIVSNGTTTGGIAGGVFTVTCGGLNIWLVEGTFIGSGTRATPFAG